MTENSFIGMTTMRVNYDMAILWHYLASQQSPRKMTERVDPELTLISPYQPVYYRKRG